MQSMPKRNQRQRSNLFQLQPISLIGDIDEPFWCSQTGLFAIEEIAQWSDARQLEQIA